MTSTPGTFPSPPPIAVEHNLSAPEWGMVGFLVSEVAFFSTLIVAYVTFLGKDTVGPTPAEALALPLAIGTTVCLLASSGTIHLAERMLHRDRRGTFGLLWALSIALGLAFLAGTAYEWRELIVHKHLTISRNLFGTSYYTLVGFHALHVTAGIVVMLIVLVLALRGDVTPKHGTAVKLTSWYWHFVDAVWIAVFLVVYVASTRGGS